MAPHLFTPSRTRRSSSCSGGSALSATKHALRVEGLARRDALSPAYREEASREICRAVLALPELSGVSLVRASPVAGYAPIRSEADALPILIALRERGADILLPRVEDPTLAFVLWRKDDPLEKGAFGIHVPPADAPVLAPRTLLMPLARFDRHGNRIGYGKGHYDRAIAALDARGGEDGALLTIGLAFDVQETETIPAEEHDRRLDIIVTETRVIRA